MDEENRTFGKGDRYLVERVLGEGAMGRVLLARDRELQRPVALKVITAHLLDRDNVRARFEREAQIQASLEHPNVVRVYDCRLDDEDPFLVMEYVDGEDLGAIMKDRGPLDPAEVQRIGEEIADALETLHRKGVIHRDIKPTNIMVRREDGAAMLMDLGLASQENAETLTRTGQVVGTPRYFPPEILLGTPWEPAGDQFQLAAVLFEALTGAYLIPGRKLDEIVARAMGGNLSSFPPDLAIPEHLRVAVTRGGSAEPTERYPSAGLFARALGGEDVSVPVEETGPLFGEDSSMSFPGAASEALAPVDPGPPPGKEFGRVLLAVVAGLAALSALLFRGPAAAPRVLRLEIVGDALLLELDPMGARGVQVDLDGRPLHPESTGGEGPLRYMFHGLADHRDARLDLRWEGGAIHHPVRGEALAVGPRAELAAEGRLRIVAARPVEARWAGDPREGHGLEVGVNLVPAPREGPLELRWAEGVFAFARTWDPREVYGRAVARLQELAGQVEVPRNLSLETLTGLAAETQPVVEEWRALAEWIPRILASDLDVGVLRRFHASWEAWDRAIPALRYLQREKGEVEVADGALGDRFWLPPFAPMAEDPQSVEADLFLGDGRAPPQGVVALVPEEVVEARRRGGDPARSEVYFRWPAGVPTETVEVLLALEVSVLEDGFFLRALGSPDGVDPPFQASFPPEKFRLGQKGTHDGWAVTSFPARIVPPAGTSVTVEVRPYVGREDTVAVIRGVRVHWRNPGEPLVWWDSRRKKREP